MKLTAPAVLLISLLLVSGCTQQDTEKTKQQAAKSPRLS
jgi:outer membrane lipoprotein-sorting protein